MQAIRSSETFQLLIAVPGERPEPQTYESLTEVKAALENFSFCGETLIGRVQIFKGNRCVHDSERIDEKPRATLRRIDLYFQRQHPCERMKVQTNWFKRDQEIF